MTGLLRAGLFARPADLPGRRESARVPSECELQRVDGLVLAVSHKPYAEKDEAYFQSITSDNAVLVDIKGLYRGKMKDIQYWSL